MSEGVYTIPGPTDDTYENLRLTHPGNTAQRGEPEAPKNRYKSAAVCLGLLCLLLVAGIIGLVIYNSELIKEKNYLVRDLDRYINLTTQNDQILSTCNKQLEDDLILKKKLCETQGFTFDGAGCYYVSSVKESWEFSRQFCRARQSDLMVINSKDKQDFVERLDKWVWLGLTDTEEEGVWMWVDGTPLTAPTYWGSGEPNNKGSRNSTEEDCVEFVTFSGNRGWNDRQCSAVNYWMCEMF